MAADVSVVISTYNRCSLLARALESLRHQESVDVCYEVLVVDNNSTDETREITQRVIQNKDCRMRAMQGLPAHMRKLLPSPTTMCASPAAGCHASKPASLLSPVQTS